MAEDKGTDTGELDDKGTPPADPPTGDAGAGETEAEKLKAQLTETRKASRQWQERAKSNAAELEELKRQGMTENEAAVAKARDDGRAEALAKLGPRLLSAEVRVQAQGRPLDVDALVEGIDAGRFLDDDGAPDADKIAEWLNRVAPIAEVDEDERVRLPAFPDLGQGRRTGQSKDDNALNGDPLLAALKSKLGA